MAEYINRESIMKFPIRKDHCDKEHANEHFINGIETVLEYAENLPTADVAPVVHGRWIDAPLYGSKNCRCSECRRLISIQASWRGEIMQKYCPNCGAIMDGGVDNETD